MRFTVVPEVGGAGRVLGPSGMPERVPDLASWMAGRDARWVVPSVEALYPELLKAGVRLDRCHDLALTEGILLAFEERPGRPRNLAAAWARMRGLAEPDDPRPATRTEQPTLFETEREPAPAGTDMLSAAEAVYADQQRRIAATARGRCAGSRT